MYGLASGATARLNDGKLYPRGPTKYGYLDRTGHWAIEPQYDWASNFSEGSAWVRMGQSQYRFIRRDGALINGEVYDEAGSFRNGLALVRQGTKHALIDLQGRVSYSISVSNHGSDTWMELEGGGLS